LAAHLLAFSEALVTWGEKGNRGSHKNLVDMKAARSVIELDLTRLKKLLPEHHAIQCAGAWLRRVADKRGYQRVAGCNGASKPSPAVEEKHSRGKQLFKMGSAGAT